MFLNSLIDVLLIVLCFLLFGYIHSLTASISFKLKIISILGDKIAFYRLFYNIFSLILFWILYSLMPQPDITIYDLPTPFDFIILIPQFIGLGGFIWTLKYFSVMEFLGIEQIIRWKKGEYNINDADEKMTFRVAGPYKYSRHPLYFFSIMFLLFRPIMDLFYLTLLICIILYFYIGSVYEEKKLVERFGEVYLRYKERVPRIIPSINPNKQITNIN